MKYPTLKEVEAAGRYDLCRWARFLDSPGLSAVYEDPEVLEAQSKREAIISTRISERLKEFGGFTPEISKSLGWRK